MAKPTNTPLNSPLVSAFNNIVNINRSKSTMRSTQNSYNEFLRFMNVEVRNIEAIKLPEEKQIKKLSNLNVASTFGSAGSLLSSLVSGALDAAGLVGNFFGGGKDKAKANKAGKPIPKAKGIRLGGIRAIGIANAVFAGLDFATGLAQGESVGKSAAGTGGALAGSLLGGAIGQALIPVPGLGFVIGSMAGNFLGGYAADRGYEAATGGDKVKEKVKAKLKAQEKKQKLEAAATQLTLPQVLDKFDGVVTQFERAVQNIALGTPSEEMSQQWDMGETEADKIDYRPDGTTEFTPIGTGDEVFPLIGGRPVLTQGGGTFNASRDGGTRRHNAQDIGVDPNTTVVASRPGTVLQSYPSGYGAAGGAVVIRYDNGQQGLYGHTIPVVKVGDKVKAGQKIATVAPDGGNTHLHYMRKDTRGNYIDPLPILQQSKSGVPLVQGQKQESKKDLQQQSQFGKDTGDSAVSKKSQMVPNSKSTTKPSQDLSQMSTDQLKQMLDPKVTSSTNLAVFKAEQEARIKGEESGLSGNDLERQIMIASIKARNAESQVMSMMQQPVIPQQLQQYPSYNTSQNSVTFIPMMMGGGGGGSQQRPMVVSSGSGGNQTTIMPSIAEGQVLNSLFKAMLLTNLSGS
jgi:murein DD-endopeptidase MepM/ murein hydrolase activator NlpD